MPQERRRRRRRRRKGVSSPKLPAAAVVGVVVIARLLVAATATASWRPIAVTISVVAPLGGIKKRRPRVALAARSFVLSKGKRKAPCIVPADEAEHVMYAYN